VGQVAAVRVAAAAVRVAVAAVRVAVAEGVGLAAVDRVEEEVVLPAVAPRKIATAGGRA